MPLSEAEIQAECDAALADAGYTKEQVRFFRLPELGTAITGAAWFRPHQDIEAGAGFPNDAQRADANRPENRGQHRITVPAEPTGRALFAGLVRHELEHARQWDAGLRIFDLHDLIEHELLPEVAAGLDGCKGGLINTIPTEIDCNAAASVYLAGRFGSADIQAIRDSDRRNLVCSLIPPPSPDTLPARMLAFVYIHGAAAERLAASRGFPLEQILTTAYPEGRAFWKRLEEGL